MSLRSSTVALLGVAAAVPCTASAATVTVTTTGESTVADGQCSLREAIATVNVPGSPTDCGTADFSGNAIVLGAHVYTLSTGPDAVDDNSTGDLDLDESATGMTTIVGAGAA